MQFSPTTYSVIENSEISLRTVLNLATAFEVTADITASGSATRKLKFT